MDIFGPPDFSIRGKKLDNLSFEEAAQEERQCEEFWFQVGRKNGCWNPTRQIAQDALRAAFDETRDLWKKVRWLTRAVCVESLAIAAFAISTIILLLK